MENTTSLCELMSLSLVRYLLPLQAWRLELRISMLNTEREISKAAIEREREMQRRIDASQARMCSDLAMLKIKLAK